MRLYRLFCCIVLSVSFLSAAEEPGGPWKEERSDENLSIFSREVPGTDIREVKATALMTGTIKEAVDIIFDRKNHPGNMPYIVKSVVLSKDDRCDVSYNIISPPIASNRDYLVRSCADKVSSIEVKLWWEPATDPQYPETDKNVRVKVNRGYYVFRQIEPDKLLVDYYIYTDPGGSLPIFVKNIANRTGVSDVLESLEKTILKAQKEVTVLPADLLSRPLDDRKKTFFTHVAFMSFEEFVWGIFVLAEVVLRRELHASALVITLFTILNPASSLFSVYFSQMLSARPDRIYRHIRLVAFITRLPLILFFLWHDAVSLLLLFGLFNIGVAMLKPVQSIYMRENFRPGEIGNLYGVAVSVAKVFFIASSYGFGLWMDVNHSSYITAFGGSGIVAFLSVLLLLLVPFHGWRTVEASPRPKDLLGFATTRETLRENAPFRRFEAAFMTYGAGFMVVLPAMPILLVDHLNLSYSVVSFGRGVMSALFLIIFTPFLGTVLDRRDPIYLSKISFFILIAYPAFLIAAWFLRDAATPLFYLSFAAFGIAMAGVTLTWNVGPMYFAATPQEIPRLMSVHVTLTGVRGLLVPIAGYLLLQIGILAPFIASVCCFCAAGFMMRRDGRILLTAEKKSV